MIEAIIYESNAGHVKKYAEILAKKMGIDAYSLKEAKIKNKSNIIFMSWIKNGKIQKLKKARRKYNIKAIGAVGMNAYSKNAIAVLQEKNKVNPLKEKLFYLQGGFDMNRIKGINRFIMSMLLKSLSKVSEARKLEPAQNEMLKMLKNPIDNVKVNNIRELYAWYNKEGKE